MPFWCVPNTRMNMFVDVNICANSGVDIISISRMQNTFDIGMTKYSLVSIPSLVDLLMI